MLLIIQMFYSISSREHYYFFILNTFQVPSWKTGINVDRLINQTIVNNQVKVLKRVLDTFLLLYLKPRWKHHIFTVAIFSRDFTKIRKKTFLIKVAFPFFCRRHFLLDDEKMTMINDEYEKWNFWSNEFVKPFHSYNHGIETYSIHFYDCINAF